MSCNKYRCFGVVSAWKLTIYSHFCTTCLKMGSYTSCHYQIIRRHADSNKSNFTRPRIRRQWRYISKDTNSYFVSSIYLHPRKIWTNQYKNMRAQSTERNNVNQFTQNRRRFTQLITYHLCPINSPLTTKSKYEESRLF